MSVVREMLIRVFGVAGLAAGGTADADAALDAACAATAYMVDDF